MTKIICIGCFFNLLCNCKNQGIQNHESGGSLSLKKMGLFINFESQ
jgi:hypothetical protein